MSNAVVRFDGAELKERTSKDGIYRLSKIKPGKHKIETTVENAEFLALNVDLSLKDAKIPDLIPNRYTLKYYISFHQY